MELPVSLVQSLHGLKGFEEESFLAAHEQIPPVSIRFNPSKYRGDERIPFEVRSRVKWSSEGVYLEERPVFTLDPLLHAGVYYVQEASSMFVDHILRKCIDENILHRYRVLDLCAAPGGKTTLLNSLLPNSLILGNEIIKTRVPILEENLVKWGSVHSFACSEDPSGLGKLENFFDIILVDAPCSGSGLFRKDPEAIKEWSDHNVRLCSERQQRILADIWPALKEEGIMLYSTCSYSPAEDEEVLDWIAESFDAESVSVSVPQDWNVMTVVSGKGATGYRFFPHLAEGEGFFIAAFRKKGGAASWDGRMEKIEKPSREIRGFVEEGMVVEDHLELCMHQDAVQLISREDVEDFQWLKKRVRLRKAGTLVGHASRKQLIPDHAWALSTDYPSRVPVVELEKEAALDYLRRQEIKKWNGVQKGWCLVSYQGHNLGWVKDLGNRINNYYPLNWRIRML
jgi:16S rRNA C967 or C1407 C5-methylase (RsmB/RsmF family)/NOL1/NOP2/fmu family ribosome biogenesis protein